MLEAMACGTPLLAFRCGSVPEVIDEAVSGMIVESIEEAVAAVPKLLKMDRCVVCQRFEERFSATRMANDYVKLYRKLMEITPRQQTEKEVRLPVAFEPLEVELIN